MVAMIGATGLLCTLSFKSSHLPAFQDWPRNEDSAIGDVTLLFRQSSTSQQVCLQVIASVDFCQAMPSNANPLVCCYLGVS